MRSYYMITVLKSNVTYQVLYNLELNIKKTRFMKTYCDQNIVDNDTIIIGIKSYLLLRVDMKHGYILCGKTENYQKMKLWI